MKAEASLRKRDQSYRYRCENSPWRAVPGPGRPEVTRHSRENGPRAASAFQRGALGQETTHWGRLITCPNAPFPTPMPCCLPPCALSNDPLPTPMPYCLPQYGKARRVAYPNTARHSQLPAPMHRYLPQCGGARTQPRSGCGRRMSTDARTPCSAPGPHGAQRPSCGWRTRWSRPRARTESRPVRKGLP